MQVPAKGGQATKTEASKSTKRRFRHGVIISCNMLDKALIKPNARKRYNLFKLTNEPCAHELWRALIDALTIADVKTYGELVFSALLARHLYGTFAG